jgi:hypothetical protein
MKNTLGSVAIAALIAGAVPALAQTSGATQPLPPSSVQSGAPMRPDASGTSTPRHHARKHAMAPNDKGPTSDDNIADQLNRQELQQLGATPGGAASGSTTR